MTGIWKSLRLAAVIAGVGGAFIVAAPEKAQARDSFSLGYFDGRSGLSFGISDGRRYDRDRRGDRRHYRRYVPPPVYYYPPPRRYVAPPAYYYDYYPPPPPPPVYYRYRY
jgi:hypothetical protein